MTRKRLFPAPVGALVAVFAAGALVLSVPAGRTADDPSNCSGLDPNSNEAAACIAGDAEPVPSLDPEWSANFTPPAAPRVRSLMTCRPVNLVFYAETDWLRLAQKLAANPSPCAQYYISIPPLAADKTSPRTAQPGLIHALGPQFHVIYEFNLTGWRTWVDGGNGTWYQAGVEWRRRIRDTASFDSGRDIWGLNELGSATRTGNTQRANQLESMRGLYDGPAGDPPVKGLVWTTGMSQSTTNLAPYKLNELESWYGDAAYWAAVGQYVQFWSQENYGDIRRWAVPGANLGTRTAYLTDYLEHIEILAGVGPEAVSTAKDTIRTTDAPLGNAAWAWSSGYGWTYADYVLMKAFVANQVYAFRHSQAGTPWRAGDAFGLAWAPIVSTAHPLPPWLTNAQFVAQSAEILDQLASSIHASDAPADDAGIGACGPDTSWCVGDLDAASFYPYFHMFWTWTQPSAVDSTPTVVEDTPTPVALDAADADGDPLTYTIVDEPQHGTLTGDAGQRTYTPAANYNGTDTFTFRVNDGVMDSRLATVSIAITPVNDSPVVELASAGPIDEGAAPLALTATATDVDNDPLSYTWTTSAGTVLSTAGTAMLQVDDGPAVAHVTVAVDDGQGGTDAESINVVVRNVPPTPEAGAALAALWRRPLAFSGSASDPSTADAASLAATWTFGDNTPAVADFATTHAYDHPGTYTATLTVTDKDSASTSDTVEVQIDARPAKLYFAGPYVVIGPWATLYARIWDPTDRQTARLRGHPLTIHLGTKSCSANTHAGGLAMCAIKVAGMRSGLMTVSVTFAGDELYTAADTSATIWLI